MQSSSDPLKFSILYTLTALANPTGKVIDPKKEQGEHPLLLIQACLPAAESLKRGKRVVAALMRYRKGFACLYVASLIGKQRLRKFHPAHIGPQPFGFKEWLHPG
jgi:hypothetical protein